MLPDRNGNRPDGERPDISARGMWSPAEKTFFDIQVTHPNAESYLDKPLSAIYREKEAQKKRKYNDRIINVERATFSPLVFSTTGGMAPECQRLNKHLAEKIAQKRGEQYGHVMNHVRTRLRFALLKATLIAVRGVRGHGKGAAEELDIDDISFNLIPRDDTYESR